MVRAMSLDWPAAMGVPLPAARSRVGAAAGGPALAAEEALPKALARLRSGGCAATMTLADLAEDDLGDASGRASDDRQAPLAARHGDAR